MAEVKGEKSVTMAEVKGVTEVKETSYYPDKDEWSTRSNFLTRFALYVSDKARRWVINGVERKKSLEDHSFNVIDMEAAFWMLSTQHRYKDPIPGESLVKTIVNQQVEVKDGSGTTVKILSPGFTYEDLFNVIGCSHPSELIHLNGRTIPGHPDSCGLVTKWADGVLHYSYHR